MQENMVLKFLDAIRSGKEIREYMQSYRPSEDMDKADGLLSEIRKGGFAEAAEIGTVDEAREGEPLLRFV